MNKKRKNSAWSTLLPLFYGALVGALVGALCAAYAGGHNIPQEILDTVVANNHLDLDDVAKKINETFW